MQGLLDIVDPVIYDLMHACMHACHRHPLSPLLRAGATLTSRRDATRPISPATRQSPGRDPTLPNTTTAPTTIPQPGIVVEHPSSPSLPTFPPPRHSFTPLSSLVDVFTSQYILPRTSETVLTESFSPSTQTHPPPCARTVSLMLDRPLIMLAHFIATTPTLTRVGHGTLSCLT
jgi:hypothetical protein